MLERWGVQGRRGIKGENWEKCNSIINKIYLEKNRLWVGFEPQTIVC